MFGDGTTLNHPQMITEARMKDLLQIAVASIRPPGNKTSPFAILTGAASGSKESLVWFQRLGGKHAELRQPYDLIQE